MKRSTMKGDAMKNSAMLLVVKPMILFCIMFFVMSSAKAQEQPEKQAVAMHSGKPSETKHSHGKLRPCADDTKKFCADAKGIYAKRKCLKAHESEVSDACKHRLTKHAKRKTKLAKVAEHVKSKTKDMNKEMEAAKDTDLNKDSMHKAMDEHKEMHNNTHSHTNSGCIAPVGNGHLSKKIGYIPNKEECKNGCRI